MDVFELFSDTIQAGSCEGELTPADFRTGSGSGAVAQLPGDVNLMQIRNSAAVVTDKVNMGLGVAIESLDAIDCSQALDHSLLLEQSQVPVDRSQGDVGVFFLEHLKQGFR